MRVSESRKRKLADVVRGLLGSGFEGTQEEICHQLAAHGYEITQSTVSRTLRKLGASRSRKGHKTIYHLPVAKKTPQLRGALQDLVLELTANESTIVIRTTPGTAMFLAGFLDHKRPGEILGTVAGDDTIFIAPESTQKLSETIKNLRRFLAATHMVN